MILSSRSIMARAVWPEKLEFMQAPEWEPMIAPFEMRSKSHGMTYGLGPAGYDVRIAENLTIMPQELKLASIMEYMIIPFDLIAFCHDKSTWARRGITLQNTVIEPGWRGYLTIEITNHGREMIHLHAGMPIAQIIFHQLDHPTDIPYEGKYQDQEPGPQAARYDK